MLLNRTNIYWLKKAQELLFFVFLITLFKGSAINNISYVLILIITFLTSERKSFKIKPPKSFKTVILLITICYLIFDLSVLGSFQENTKLLARYLVLFTAPLLFLNANSESFKKIYLMAYTVFFCLTIYSIVTNYVTYNAFNFYKFGGNAKDYMFIERLYFGFMSVLASIFIIDRFKVKIALKYSLLISVLLVIFLIASRFAFFVIFLLLFNQIRKDFKNNISFVKIGVGILFISVLFLLGLRNEGFKKRLFLNSNSVENFILNIKINEPRHAIWKSSLTLVKQNDFDKLTGFRSITELRILLVESYKKNVYIKSKRDWFVQKKFNTHNQYLFVFLLNGGLGLMLLLISLGLLYFYNNLELAKSISFLVILFFLIENPFNRQIGTYLVTICVALICQKHIHK